MSKRFAIILVLVVGALVGLFVWGGGKSKDTTSNKYQGDLTSIQATDHKAGAGNKKVTLIEYGDFQCPFCGNFFSIMEQVRDNYKDDITFVFRNFPLSSIHQNAQAAARAAEAASNQNKFFEMYQQLFSTQKTWSSSSNPQSIFEGFAQQLGLSVDQFKTDYASEAVNSRIAADQESGKKLGVTGTPTVFLNGKQLDTQTQLTDYETFKKLIDEQIAKSNPTQ